MPGPDPDILDLIRNPKMFGLTSPVRQHFAVRLGQAVNINDLKKKGRVAVRIIGIQPVTNPDGTSTDDLLHWAQTAYSTAGDFHLPSVGDVGFIVFLQGDFRQPVWIGTLIKAPDGNTELPTEFQQQYDANQAKGIVRGFVTPAGSKFVVTDKIDDRDIVIETPGGRKVSIRDDVEAGGSEKQGITLESNGYEIKLNEEDGEISVTAPGNVTMNVTGNVELNVTGDIKLGAGLTAALNGIVTRLHPCAFTGVGHPAGSSTVMAKP